MTDRSQPDSASNGPNRRFTPRSLAKVMAFCLLFSSLAVTLLENALGRTLGRSAQQPAQAPRDAGNKADDEKETRLLEPGKAIKRELAGAGSHTYQIRLAADQFLKVIVEQQGIDVVVQLSGPDGGQIAEFDGEIRSRGQELAPFVAEADGEYRLTILPLRRNAQAGGYEIRVEELRAATDDDRALHEARKLLREGRKLANARKYQEALPLIERGLKIRERLLGQEHRYVADALNNLGLLYSYKGEFEKAEPLYQLALAIRERALEPEHPDVAQSLNSLANIYREKADYAKAERLYLRALNIKEKVLGPEHPDLAGSLNNLAIIYDDKCYYAKAEPLFLRALNIREKVLGSE